MKEFTHFIKLYGFPLENRVSLSFRSGPRHVLTFHITGETFDRIIREHGTKDGSNHPPFFVHRKGDYIRFSHSAASLETNIRIPKASWEAVLLDYSIQKEKGVTPLITCLA